MKRLIVLAPLMLAGCIDLPRSTLPQTPSDRVAVDAAVAALVDARGPLAGCEILDRVDVISLPLDGSGATVRQACMQQAQSCVYVVQRHVGAPASTLVYVRDDVDERTRAALIAHEILHTARGCWIQTAAADPVEYRRRWHLGQSAECAIPWGPDAYHCDTALWSVIERDAILRWAAAQ